MALRAEYRLAVSGHIPLCEFPHIRGERFLWLSTSNPLLPNPSLPALLRLRYNSSGIFMDDQRYYILTAFATRRDV